MAMSHIAWAASLGLKYDLRWKQEQKAKETFSMHAFRLFNDATPVNANAILD